MNKDKNTDKLFREKLLNYEQQPPAHLLENVLAGTAAARRNRKLVFWRVAGVAAALLLAFVAGWQFNYMKQQTVNQPNIVRQNSSAKAKEENNVVSEKATGSDKIQEAIVARNQFSGTKYSGKSGQMTSRITLPAQMDSRAIRPMEKSNSEPIAASRNEESGALHPLKTVVQPIGSNNQFKHLLEEKKLNRSLDNNQELTLDQQIIQQNQQLLRAQYEPRKKTHWLVGAQVSPAYSVNRSSHSSQYENNMLNSSSQSPVELGGGLSVEYKRGKRWSLQSGVYYSGLGQSSGNTSNSSRSLFANADMGAEFFNAPASIVAGKMMINSSAGVIQMNGIPSGVVLGTNLEDKSLSSAVVLSDASFIQNFQYIEIPLYLRYTILDARFNVELIGGVGSNVLVGNQTFLQTSTGKSLVGKTQDMQGLNYSGTFGLGLKYGLSKRIFLNVEPRIKYFLRSLNSNPAVNYKPYTIGVYTGLSYRF